MKRFFLIAILLFSFCGARSQTTLQEYNYLINGKLDTPLMGHTLKMVGDPLMLNYKDAMRSTLIYELYREKEEKPCAILISYQKQGFPVVLLCVPSAISSVEIMKAFQTRLREISTSVRGTAMFQTIIFSLGTYAMR